MNPLYVIASPIGNPEDMTLRSLRVLKEEITLVVCEDTRVTKRLLMYYDIDKPMISCHAKNEDRVTEKIVASLKKETIGYLCDAGTPGISDPGSFLIQRVLEAEGEVIPLPGVSATTTLISVAGVPTPRFFFEGFLPKKGKKREKKIAELMNLSYSVIFYESPLRVLSLLESLVAIDSSRSLVIGRELTKKYEEITRGEVGSLLAIFRERVTMQGEFSIILLAKE